MSATSDATRPIEEVALFNPAFIALLAHTAANAHDERSGGRPLPTMLVYLVAPLTLHGPTRRALPRNVRAQMGEWIRAHPEAVAGLDSRSRSLRPLVSNALQLALQHGLIAAEDGAIRARPLPRRPRGMARTEEVDECIDKAGFLGRWFSELPDAATTLALWGLRP